MKLIGMLLWLGGLAIGAYAILIFDPSVSFAGERIVNLDLQQRQLIMALAGCALFLAGVVLHGMGYANRDASVVGGRMVDQTAVIDEKGNLPPLRLAYARQLGIIETETGFEFSGSAFSSLEDAILAATATRS